LNQNNGKFVQVKRKISEGKEMQIKKEQRQKKIYVAYWH